jgi:hypothetical protein
MKTQAFGKWIALLATCFMLVFCLAYFSALKMEASSSSETSVGLHSVISRTIGLFMFTPTWSATFHSYFTR